jgi:hypothetical protein
MNDQWPKAYIKIGRAWQLAASGANAEANAVYMANGREVRVVEDPKPPVTE